MAHKLEVWLFADRVGTLALVDGRLNFCYATDRLSHRDAVALSASLPLQAEPFDDRKTRPYFAGLLPEGQMRRLIAQQLQVSGQNDFALLDHIGGECVGAGTFLEPGQVHVPFFVFCKNMTKIRNNTDCAASRQRSGSQHAGHVSMPN